MRPLHKWQSLNALFYLHYLSPSEVRKSREGGREEGGRQGGRDGGREGLIPSSCTQTERCAHTVKCAAFVWRRKRPSTPADSTQHTLLSL